jgi:Ca-activated chloride channel homolog
LHALILLVLCGGGTAAARSQTPWGPVPEFRSGIDLVTLHVSVTDRREHYLTDLNATDFQVFEDGEAQQLAFFQPSGLPLALTLILDTSGSVMTTLPASKAAAADFIETLGSGDIASVIAFDTHVTVLQNFTADRNALTAAIQRAPQGDSTSVYTAVYIALKELQRVARNEGNATPRRRVIVLFSDGDDNSSMLSFDDLVNAAIGSDTAIYAIRLGRAPFPLHGPDSSEFVLRRLSEQTGGRTFFPQSERDLPRVFKQIRAELASQYALAYVSNDRQHQRGFRQLAVLVSRAGAVARTKKGYVAAGR